MKRFCLARFCLILFSAHLFSTLADTLVVPKELESKEDPAWSGVPFNAGSGSRIQMLYPAQNFLESMPFGGVITEVAFRLDGPNGNPGNVTLDTHAEIELRVSTSPSMAASMPIEFVRNVGTDETTVFSRGVLELKSTWIREGPNPFSLRIPFEKEFMYDPRVGNLLLDFFIHKERAGQRIFVEYTGIGDGVGGPIGSQNGTLLGGVAAIRITFTPVPEPSVWFLIIAGFYTFILKSKPL